MTDNPPGRFITFEGGEGAGKSTQIRALKAFLDDTGIEALMTREPGGTPGAEEIRNLLVTGEPDRWDAMTEALLNTAARRDHVTKVIWPALDRGAWVLCDRFSASTLAYQGRAGGLGFDALNKLYAFAIGKRRPDLTFVMDVPVETGLERAGARTDSASRGETRFEGRTPEFHAMVREAFLEIAARQPDRCIVVDATAPEDSVTQKIVQVVKERFGLDG